MESQMEKWEYNFCFVTLEDVDDDEMTGMCVKVVKFSRPQEFSIDWKSCP